MMELPLVVVAGMLGSAHCIGMCGPFALAVGASAKSARGALGRQLVFTMGRIFTYSVFGAVAAFAGWRLAQTSSSLIYAAAGLTIAAGVFLAWQGVAATGLLPGRAYGAGSGCLMRELHRQLMTRPGLAGLFLAGVFTGMMPCGLVYGFLALAAASRDMAYGAALMAAFGLGTAPLMALAGCSGSLLTVALRHRLNQAAAWCLVVTGALAIFRGVSFLPLFAGSQEAACPFCP